jgi:hypothetical protein
MNAWLHGTRIAVGVGLLVGSGCSRHEPAAGRPASAPPPEVATVVEAGWGSAEGQLGAARPDEGSPEGPKSFVVDAAGRVHVLDQVNQRIQSFDSGAPSGALALPDRPFEDIELDTGGFLLLDLFETPSIVGLGLDGTVSGQVPLPAEEIPEPGLSTALDKHASGIWVEVEDELLVRVADASGNPVEPSVVPGQLVSGEQVFRAVLDSSTVLEIHRQASADSAPEPFASISFPHSVRGLSLLAPGVSGGLVLITLLEVEQTDPEQPADQQHVFVELTPGGKEIRRHALPASQGALEAFRSARRGADGKLYVMTSSDAGVAIVQVTP